MMTESVVDSDFRRAAKTFFENDAKLGRLEKTSGQVGNLGLSYIKKTSALELYEEFVVLRDVRRLKEDEKTQMFEFLFTVYVVDRVKDRSFDDIESHRLRQGMIEYAKILNLPISADIISK